MERPDGGGWLASRKQGGKEGVRAGWKGGGESRVERRVGAGWRRGREQGGKEGGSRVERREQIKKEEGSRVEGS